MRSRRQRASARRKRVLTIFNTREIRLQIVHARLVLTTAAGGQDVPVDDTSAIPILNRKMRVISGAHQHAQCWCANPIHVDMTRISLDKTTEDNMRFRLAIELAPTQHAYAAAASEFATEIDTYAPAPRIRTPRTLCHLLNGTREHMHLTRAFVSNPARHALSRWPRNT